MVLDNDNKPATAMVQDESYRRQLEPSSLDALFKVAHEVARVSLCGVSTPQEAFARMATGRELGLSMMQSLRGVYLVEGRPALDASLMHALCEQAADCEYFRCTESTEERATYETKRRGQEPQTLTFTLKDADRAGLLNRGSDPKKNNWNKYPKEMLRARAKSGLARMVYPDKLFGLYSREELLDGDVTDAAVPVRVEVHAVRSADRDVAAEYAELEAAIRGVGEDKNARSAMRARIKAFAEDVGEEWGGKAKALYNDLYAAKKPAPVAPPSEPAREREPGEEG